eukprot:TRINITY_DN25955_c0_g1_i1.p1 TRINITY_DN25955_c0_g1~~TRINITY_DN25955_c0_g1_i1.p1  ORF type:complete len:768 (-),score=176.14 TRINITY_DN25955_c0_g1_i1:254-2557(-)
MTSSIFGHLDKRARRVEAAAAAAAGTSLASELSFEDRADLLNDLLEDDETKFPLLSCPHEVLHAILVLLPVATTLRMRSTCQTERGSIDTHASLWGSLIMRDFEDLGGSTKHYRGLRMSADAWTQHGNHQRQQSGAVRRLEWDPLMLCAPPALRYTLLAASQARRELWEEHGHALGAGWAWFSAKVCRRMAASTFQRWAMLQHGEGAVRGLLIGHPDDCQIPAQESAADAGGGLAGNDKGEASEVMETAVDGDGVSTAQAAAICESAPTATTDGAAPSTGSIRFRCGRSDSMLLTQEAATDIYETVRRWHGAEHREAMRAHIKGEKDKKVGSHGEMNQTASAAFSVTPTLDVAEMIAVAAAQAAEAAEKALVEAAVGVEVENEAASAAAAVTTTTEGDASAQRGAASRRLEEAQLRLALEMSKNEAECASDVVAEASSSGLASAVAEPSAAAEETAASEVKKESLGLELKTEGTTPHVVVFLKEHCLAARVDDLPDRFSRSIDSIVDKMVKTSWGLLYESVTEEIGFRAKGAAQALFAAHARAVDHYLSEGFSLEQERMSLPIWRNSRGVMTGLSQLRTAICAPELRQARCGLVKQASLEWCELEDFTAFLDEQLGKLELAIDGERGLSDMIGHAHTPHIRDLGRLMFRNCCLLDSRIFRPLCLAAYALVHEIHAAQSARESESLIEILESLHEMLAGCDVADDHLSASKDTKEIFAESLVVPVTAALERYSPWDIRGEDGKQGVSGGVRDDCNATGPARTRSRRMR